MGCIYSKAITRSMSIREELSQGFSRTSLVWEDLLTSHAGNSQLLAFGEDKLRSSSFTLPSTDLKNDLEAKYLANVWDLIPDFKSKTEVKSNSDDVIESSSGRFTRSKSCQIVREKNMLDFIPETENKLDWRDKNRAGSRSFHTVEDYDALLERIHNSISRSEEMDREDSKSLQNSINFENFIEEEGGRETGWKRKAAAKELKSLEISSIEFPSIAKFRQKIQSEGQVDSPGTYITPKFGSYNKKESFKRREDVFDEEFLASFEECMQQLQVEEDSILRHIDGVLTVEESN